MDARQFGELVRRRRKAAGITQRDLALIIGTGERFVVDLEKGKETSRLALALKAAAAVGIKLVDASETVPSGPASSPGEGYDLPWLGDEP